ncbi:hypothetical protein AlacWU_11361 [Aspergillus niger]|nr:hypothetical protein AlacWU_11361 [Aspergillus niger]
MSTGEVVMGVRDKNIGTVSAAYKHLRRWPWRNFLTFSTFSDPTLAGAIHQLSIQLKGNDACAPTVTS